LRAGLPRAGLPRERLLRTTTVAAAVGATVAVRAILLRATLGRCRYAHAGWLERVIRADRVFVVALLAAHELAARLGRLAHEVGRVAVRARPRYRLVPRRPVAFRIARAAPERLPATRTLLADLTDVALRARQTGDGARL